MGSERRQSERWFENGQENNEDVSLSLLLRKNKLMASVLALYSKQIDCICLHIIITESKTLLVRSYGSLAKPDVDSQISLLA